MRFWSRLSKMLWVDETFGIINANTVANNNAIAQNNAVLAELMKEVRLLGLIGKHLHQPCLLLKTHPRLQRQRQQQLQQLRHRRPRPGTPTREAEGRRFEDFRSGFPSGTGTFKDYTGTKKDYRAQRVDRRIPPMSGVLR